jgi:biotin carboxyl carrier protein
MSKLSVTIDDRTFEVELTLPQGTGNSTMLVLIDGAPLQVTIPSAQRPEQMEWIVVNNKPYEIIIDSSLHTIKAYDGMHQIEVHDATAGVQRPVSRDARVKAPIPGLVTRVLVERGDQVQAGQPLVMLEAMKMENEILAPRSGKVVELNAKVGKIVTLGELLVELA